MNAKLLKKLRRLAKRNIYASSFDEKLVIIWSDFGDRYFRTYTCGWSVWHCNAKSYKEDELIKELKIARRDFIIREVKMIRNQKIIRKVSL